MLLFIHGSMNVLVHSSYFLNQVTDFQEETFDYLDKYIIQQNLTVHMSAMYISVNIHSLTITQTEIKPVVLSFSTQQQFSQKSVKTVVSSYRYSHNVCMYRSLRIRTTTSENCKTHLASFHSALWVSSKGVVYADCFNCSGVTLARRAIDL